MSTFALPDPSSPEQAFPSPPATDRGHTSRIDSDALMMTPDQELSNFWPHAGTPLHIDGPSITTEGIPSHNPDYFNFDPANLEMPDFLYELMGSVSQGSGSSDMDFKFGTDRARDDKSANPIADLSSLLSEMAYYGNRILRLPTSDYDDYPIGDALLLSQRFYNVLFTYASTNPAASQHWQDPSTYHQDIPTILLMISCYMTLTGVYLSVFTYLEEYISQMGEAHNLSQEEVSPHLHYPMGDMHAYRGMSLRQMRPVCICGSWDPEKKIVSMLLNSLGGIEGFLGLPAEARVVAQDEQIQIGESPGAIAMPSKAQGEKPALVLFRERLPAALSHGHLYKNMKEQAHDLRQKVAKVSQMLS
ncbi:hypothetical protein M426DRAFT_14260 [Hypoxylon sp. CI-4A]|nr:hypothetical protein M426DRAFT_14260 [Hypoxylon sp. CI-4A]